MAPLTVVTAYYDIPSKFSNDTYFRWIQLFLRTANCNVVFFVENEATIAQFQPWCSWPSRVQFRVVKKDDWKMLQRQKISFWDEQLRMDAREVGLHKSFMLGAVWAEKMYFVKRAIDENPFGSEKFIWCDAGIMRTDEDANRGFLFGCNEQVISDTKMHILEVGACNPVPEKDIWWWPKIPSEVRFGGGILGAHASVWSEIIPKYENILDQLTKAGICVFKDQIVWANLVLHNPDMFSVIRAHTKWFHLLEAWSLAPSPSCGINTYIINLDHRRDRWDETIKMWELDTKSNVFRFPALKHGKVSPWLKYSVTHGCAASHLSLMVVNAHDACLVLEDDADPTPNTTLDSLLSMIQSLKSFPDWDFVNFGTSTVTGLHQQSFGAIRSFNESFWETRITSTTHAMGYSCRMRKHVPELLGIARSALMLGEEIANIDYVLGSGITQKHLVQLMPKQGVLARQRLSHSDINNSIADYSFMFDIVNAQLQWMRNSWIPMPLPIVVDMQGGLGNQLFMAAAALRLAQKTGRPFALCRKPLLVNPHSSQNYMDTVFCKFPQLQDVPSHWCSICTTDAECIGTSSTTVARLRGYFQNPDGVTAEFKSLLTLPEANPIDDDCVLVHIRGGDYKGHRMHDVDLQKFRRASLSLCPRRKHLLCVTNDEPYAIDVIAQLGVSSSSTFLAQTDEVQLLSDLASSGVPLVCANSTFSWWAGALSVRPRLIFLPRTWYAKKHGHEDEAPLFRLEGALVL